MFCRDCGAELAEGRKFCGKCGARCDDGALEIEPAAAATKPPVKKGRRWPVLLLIGILVLLFLGYRWYEGGVELQISTYPSGTTITLDGRPVGSEVEYTPVGWEDSEGGVTLHHVPFGTHDLKLTHEGYAEEFTRVVFWPWSREFSQSVQDSISLPMGSKETGARRWFWRDDGGWPFASYYEKDLRMAKLVSITIETNPPGSLIYLDGTKMGQSNGSGRLGLVRVLQGMHTLKVYSYGLPISETKIDAEPDQIYRIDLREASEPDLKGGKPNP
jgi:hypothetical protein